MRHAPRRAVHRDPDRDLIAFGRAACALYPRPEAGDYAITSICPIAHRDVTAMIASEEVTYDLADAAAEVFCDLERHRPLIRAGHVAAARIWTSWGQIQSLDPALGEDAYDETPQAGLIGAEPGTVSLNVHPDFDVCLSAEVYRKRPPAETKGWDEVVEVGYRSLSGHLELTDPMRGEGWPEGARPAAGRLSDQGPFPGTDGYGPQTLLLMIFPG